MQKLWLYRQQHVCFGADFHCSLAAMDLLAFVITVWPFCSHLFFMGVELFTVFLVLWSSNFLSSYLNIVVGCRKTCLGHVMFRRNLPSNSDFSEVAGVCGISLQWENVCICCNIKVDFCSFKKKKCC